MADWDPLVNEVFLRAIEAGSPAERVAVLETSCRDDAELRRKVEALLRAHDGAGSFLDRPAPELAADPAGTAILAATRAAPVPSAAPPADHEATEALGPDPAPADGAAPRPIAEGPGTRIGPYKLLQQIGEGGMGVVYMAEQEHPVRRKVALKIIKPGMDIAQVVARFEAERQALALMDHPNIAKVLDAGATDSGRPFFVMELVNGAPITEYCDGARLTPRERLELFVPVCRAIQHAHQKGIIHRDVKPSNVLVTLVDGRPEPKVIDFGVAKAIEQRLTERTLFTQHGSVVGTLEYMSPEQAALSGVDVDTRSDVYSLGVLLYELLTGTTPLGRGRLREAGYAEMLRLIREEEPAKPSTRLSGSGEALGSIAATRGTEPARLARLVRGELDWIAMKSLEKDRSRRYDSAGGLARDIERYLADEAVEACPPSRRYRLVKFVRAHRTALATAGAFALLLVAATTLSVGLALRAERQKQRAVAAEALAQDRLVRAREREQMAIDAVKRFREAVADEPALKNGAALSELRKRLMKEPLSFFRDLRDRLRADPDARPESLARLAQASADLGALIHEIGDARDGLAAYREALAIFRALDDALPGSERFRAGLAACHQNIGDLLREVGRPAEAMTELEAARAIWLGMLDARPDDRNVRRRLAACHQAIGELFERTGRPAEAKAAFEAALAIRRELADAQPEVADLQFELSMTQQSVATTLLKAGKTGEGATVLEAALAILRKLAAAHPEVNPYRNVLANNQMNLAKLLMDGGRTVEAIAMLDAGLAIRQQLADAYPTVIPYQKYLAQARALAGVMLAGAGRLAEARASFEAARPMLRKLADANPATIEFQHSLALNEMNLGSLLGQTGNRAEAKAAFEAALTAFEKLARDQPDSPDIAFDLGGTLLNLAETDIEVGRFEAARTRLLESEWWLMKALAPNPGNPDVRRDLEELRTNLAKVARRLGDHALQAEAERKLAELRASGPPKAALDARLEAVRKGEPPRDNAERIAVAFRAYEKGLYATSARLYAEAFRDDPGLAEDPPSDKRYNAACAATLAAAGRGEDRPPPDADARARWRQQALDWLKADLERRGRTGPAPRERLARWKQDPDLAGVRDGPALAALPAAEREEWQALWAEVDRLLNPAGAG
jgi:eukaryotic-like serine/threonine-protein kinase